MDKKSYSLFNPCRKMLSKTTKNCWRGSKYSSLITRPRFKAESMTCFMQRFAIFNRFNLSTFHWASLFDSGGADELKVRTWSFPKLSSVSSSSTPAAAILFPRYIRVVWRHIMYRRHPHRAQGRHAWGKKNGKNREFQQNATVKNTSWKCNFTGALQWIVFNEIYL